jgi:hypothetical protein
MHRVKGMQVSDVEVMFDIYGNVQYFPSCHSNFHDVGQGKMPQQYRQYMFIRSRFSLLYLCKNLCSTVSLYFQLITPYACPSFYSNVLLWWVKDHIYNGYETKNHFLTNILMTSFFHNTPDRSIYCYSYYGCSRWSSFYSGYATTIVMDGCWLEGRFATRIFALETIRATTPNATVVHGTHESYKFMNFFFWCY